MGTSAIFTVDCARAVGELRPGGASYRVRAIDLWGRVGEWSEPCGV
jgi:hypothetical protein